MILTMILPSNEVMMLPDTADSILEVMEISPPPLALTADDIGVASRSPSNLSCGWPCVCVAGIFVSGRCAEQRSDKQFE